MNILFIWNQVYIHNLRLVSLAMMLKVLLFVEKYHFCLNVTCLKANWRQTSKNILSIPRFFVLTHQRERSRITRSYKLGGQYFHLRTIREKLCYSILLLLETINYGTIKKEYGTIACDLTVVYISYKSKSLTKSVHQRIR